MSFTGLLKSTWPLTEVSFPAWGQTERPKLGTQLAPNGPFLCSGPIAHMPSEDPETISSASKGQDFYSLFFSGPGL